jgi:hypothetical protein
LEIGIVTSTDKIDWNEWFYYDETSPSCLRWKIAVMSGMHRKIARRCAGEMAGGFCKTTGRYFVRLKRKSYLVHRIIYEMHMGSIADGLVIDHIDGNPSNNTVKNLRVVTGAVNTRNAKRPSTNRSSAMGVSYQIQRRRGRTYENFVATWCSCGVQHKKSFAVKKYGYDEAFRLACEHRAKMIEELNRQGAGYTERHGT